MFINVVRKSSKDNVVYPKQWNQYQGRFRQFSATDNRKGDIMH